MSKQAFIKAMGYVDDHILERYIAEDERLSARKPLWKRTWVRLTAAAACLALIVTGSFLFGRTDPDPSVSMDDLDGIFGHLLGNGTNFYSTVKVSSEEELELRPIPEQETITVYKNNRIFFPLVESEFSGYADAVLTRLAASLGTQVPEYTIANNTDRMIEICNKDGLEYDPYLYSTLHGRCEFDGTDVEFTQSKSCYTFYLSFVDVRREGITPSLGNGKALQADLRQSDAEILASLENIRQTLFSVFDVTFTDVLIQRSSDQIRVYYYNAADEVNTPMEEISSPRPFCNYIYLAFSHLEDSDDPLLPCGSITYRRSLIDPDDLYTTLSLPMRTLEEAEALLYKGYVFGGFSCLYCMEEQEAVDFENYDLVGLKYLYSTESSLYMNTWEPKNAIPFYAFYKEVSSSDGVTQYAYTYVPAIEIEGMDEYFEAKLSHHDP